MARPRRTEPAAGPSQPRRRQPRIQTYEEPDDEAEDGGGEENDQGGGNDGSADGGDVYMDGSEGDEDGAGGSGSDKDITRKANDLVRLALFVEHKRTPLRRDDILKKVLGPNTRLFSTVFELAQQTLRTTFGMELTELQSRAGLDREANEDGPGNDARGATGMKKKAAAAGSKTYILRSTLDPLLIEHAALTDERLLEEEADAASDDDDDSDHSPRSYGSILSWSTADQLGPTGILYVILALILVSGRSISDADLRTHLKRLRLPLAGGSSSSSVKFSAHATHRTLGVEAYLAGLVRQGYLDRVQIGEPGGAGMLEKGGGRPRGGVKRARLTQVAGGRDGEEGDGGAGYEWRWGNRAQSEVGEQAVGQFVAEFMVGMGDGGEEEEEAEKERGGAEARLATMMKGIGRAAGSELADLR